MNIENSAMEVRRSWRQRLLTKLSSPATSPNGEWIKFMPKPSPEELWNFMSNMADNGTQVDFMKTKDLVEALLYLDKYRMDSFESALFGEMSNRMLHPFTWWIRRQWWHWVGKRIYAIQARRRLAKHRKLLPRK